MHVRSMQPLYRQKSDQQLPTAAMSKAGKAVLRCSSLSVSVFHSSAYILFQHCMSKIRNATDLVLTVPLSSNSALKAGG